MKLKLLLVTLITVLISSVTFAEKKIFTEEEFLTIFNGKPKARVLPST
jgi:hypothetical protein